MKREIRHIGIIGLGYVGLPLGCAFAQKGFTVTGFEVDPEKIAAVNEGRSYLGDIPADTLKNLVAQKRLTATADASRLKKMDAIILCVPTPLRKSKEPDLSFVLQAVETVQKNLTAGQLVVLESTTYPGTTQELIQPMLEATGLKAGKDFFLAFSPERIDPGNKKFQIHNTPKVVGGVTTNCLELACALYQQVTEQVVPVSSPTIAELVKLLENTFRAVNIGLVNEMALICHKLGVETAEVIEAAATKPFGFLPFWPGPGLGGHCIPVDPQYLSWKLKSLKYHPRFIQLADEINMGMPAYVTGRVTTLLNEAGRAVKRADIIILGVSYKKDVGDLRESPALDVMEILDQMGANLSYYDPFIPEIQINGRCLASQPPDFARHDCVLILTDHACFDYPAILNQSRLVFDTRSVTRRYPPAKAKVVRI